MIHVLKFELLNFIGELIQDCGTSNVQSIGSACPIVRNQLGLIPRSFNALAESSCGRVSQINPFIASTQALGTTVGVGGLELDAYMKHVEILRRACEGSGTNEDDIWRVIASTNNTETALIRRLYKQKYNEDLVTRLQTKIKW